MPVYMIVEATEVLDRKGYEEYVQKVPETIKRFCGEYLARGGQVKVVSGDWNPARIIIVKFPSMDKFNAWWSSPEYQAVSPLREKSAKTNAIVVEGV